MFAQPAHCHLRGSSAAARVDGQNCAERILTLWYCDTECVLLGRVVGRVRLLQGIVGEIRATKPLAHFWSHVCPKRLPERFLELLKGLLRLSIYFDLHGVSIMSGKILQKEEYEQ